MLNILVLCTGNSARSILAEVLFNELGAGRVQAYSAGSQPAGAVNPGAIRQLESRGHAVVGLSSKSWDRFSGSDAPAMDIVITVCDNAAGESCPIWNGAPVRAHWGIADPAAVVGDEAAVDRAFTLAYERLRRRAEALLQLSIEEMDAAGLKQSLQAIAEECLRKDGAESSP